MGQVGIGCAIGVGTSMAQGSGGGTMRLLELRQIPLGGGTLELQRYGAHYRWTLQARRGATVLGCHAATRICQSRGRCNVHLVGAGKVWTTLDHLRSLASLHLGAIVGEQQGIHIGRGGGRIAAIRMRRQRRLDGVAHIELAVLTRIVALLGDVRYGVHLGWARLVCLLLGSLGRCGLIRRDARRHLHRMANCQCLEEVLLVQLQMDTISGACLADCAVNLLNLP